MRRTKRPEREAQDLARLERLSGLEYLVPELHCVRRFLAAAMFLPQHRAPNSLQRRIAARAQNGSRLRALAAHAGLVLFLITAQNTACLAPAASAAASRWLKKRLPMPSPR